MDFQIVHIHGTHPLTLLKIKKGSIAQYKHLWDYKAHIGLLEQGTNP